MTPPTYLSCRAARKRTTAVSPEPSRSAFRGRSDEHRGVVLGLLRNRKPYHYVARADPRVRPRSRGGIIRTVGEEFVVENKSDVQLTDRQKEGLTALYHRFGQWHELDGRTGNALVRKGLAERRESPQRTMPSKGFAQYRITNTGLRLCSDMLYDD